MQQVGAPTFGLTWDDIGSSRRGNYVQNAPPSAAASSSGAGASLTASATVGDLAEARGNVAIDTKVPLMGFVAGIVILAAIRLFWETASED